MRIVTGSPGVDLAVPQGNYIGFAIGPDSDYDQVRVDGVLVGAGRIVPLQVAGVPVVEFVRGPWPRITDPSVYLDYNAPYRAQLLCYECGDELVNPGPRPPRQYSFFFPAVEGDVDVAQVSFQVPFVGRRHAAINVCSTTDGDVAQFAIFGVQWVPWRQPGDGTAGIGEPDSLTIAHALSGTVAVPNTTAAGNDDLDAGHAAGASRAGDSTTAGSGGVHIGGTDSAEVFDELSIMLGGEETGTDIVVLVTVFGELGAG